MDYMNPEMLKMNAALQTKKNALRAELAEMGMIKREGKNEYDKYKYMTEAQYKKLFTELFSKHRLEIKFTELEYNTYTAEGKQPNGRLPKLCFTLFDVDTGFGEETVITGEGLDKGDKAGYKAYTGALKYFFANTFMVATEDDPETESPEAKKVDNMVTKGDVTKLTNLCNALNVNMDALLAQYKVERPEDLTMAMYGNIVKRLSEVKR